MKPTVFILLSCILFGCYTTAPVRVLPKDESVIAVSLGGPTIKVGSSDIPLPYISAGYYKGCSDDLTLGGALHFLPAVFGDLGLDASASYRLIKEDCATPEITIAGQLYLFSDLNKLNNTRLFPDVRLFGSYLISDKTLLFFGIDNLFQFSAPAYILTPSVGGNYSISTSFALQLEAKWVAANVTTAHGIFEGAGSVNGKGSIGIFLGLQFGRQR